MSKCAKCGKETNSKDLYWQWTNSTEQWCCDICKNCIKEHKQYRISTDYANSSDITFVWAHAYVQINDDTRAYLSQTLIGYLYGKPTMEEIMDWCFKEWLNGDELKRKNLLRQAFNENDKHDNEILY